LKNYSADDITVTGDISADAIYADVPSNLKKVISLLHHKGSDTYATRIVGMPRPHWDTLIGSPTDASTSEVIRYYTEERIANIIRWLRWYPVPNIDYTLHGLYLLKPTPLTDDGVISDFEDKDDLIIAGTTHYMFNRYQAFEEAEQWRKGYDAQLNTAIKDDKHKPDIAWIPRGISIAEHRAPADPWADPFVKRT
jgi:hypothetical protein